MDLPGDIRRQRRREVRLRTKARDRARARARPAYGEPRAVPGSRGDRRRRGESPRHRLALVQRAHASGDPGRVETAHGELTGAWRRVDDAIGHAVHRDAYGRIVSRDY